MKKTEAFVATLLAAGPKPPGDKALKKLRDWEHFSGHILFTLREHKNINSPFERIRRYRAEYEEFLEWLQHQKVKSKR